jgi:CBS domain-containing protein
MKVSDVMTKTVVTCRPHDTLNTAAHRMWNGDIGALPVVEGGVVKGMITDRDIAMAAHLRGRRLSELPVSNSMSKSLHCCRPEDTVSAAEKIMADHQIRRLPVVNGDKLVGILSLNDLAQASANDGMQLTAEEVGRTLSAVASPRSQVRART